MKSLITKRSIVIAGHRTSVSLEDAFWGGLREIAKGRGETLTELVGSIDAERKFSNLSSAIRLFVLGFYRDQAQPFFPVSSPPTFKLKSFGNDGQSRSAREA
jgi:predicted DNA-binding ribbon-helix-helix protein